MASGDQKAMNDSWEKIRARLRATLGEDVFLSWFARLVPEKVVASLDGQSNQVSLSVPTAFLRSWIKSHYLEDIRKLWEKELKSQVSIDITLRSNQPAQNKTAPSAARVAAESEAAHTGATLAEKRDPNSRDEVNAPDSLGSPLDPRLTLESFILGESNSLAHAAAQRIAKASANHPIVFNPFYIHASVGLGKTHLLHAIAWEALKTNPQRRVLYLTAERFMYSFVHAIKDQSTHAFKQMVRNIDLLIIDDLQFLQGNHVQQEFCHTLNTLIDSNKQVMVAADRPASQLDALSERVRSRLAGGFSAELGQLDKKTRRAILNDRAKSAKDIYPDFTISQDVIAFVADSIEGSGRDLEGAFNRLFAHNQLTQAPIDIDMAERAIRDLIHHREPKRILIEDIQRVVARHYNVSRADLVSARRTRTVVKPRQVAMYLAKAMTPRSLPEIGRRFGGRDHTTVLHAVRKIETSLVSDQLLAQEVEVLKRMIEE